MKLNKGKHVVLVIPDLQVPYEHPDALAFVEEVQSCYYPDQIVCIGDEVDQMALSRFDPDPDGDGAGPELLKALKKMDKWYAAFPEVKVCTSNHTGRIQKKAFHAGIPEAYMRTVNEWMEAPEGWEWKEYGMSTETTKVAFTLRVILLSVIASLLLLVITTPTVLFSMWLMTMS